jgi:hypothetical protein
MSRGRARTERWAQGNSGAGGQQRRAGSRRVGHERAGMIGRIGQSRRELLRAQRGKISHQGSDAVGRPPQGGERRRFGDAPVEPGDGLDQVRRRVTTPVGDD